MTIIVTGAAGFIGSNLVAALNQRGLTDVIAVDNLSRAEKFHNLVDLSIADYIDKTRFVELLQANAFGRIDAIFHEGACSDTMEHDGRYMMENNFRYSVALLDYCQANRIAFLYASSAATYGAKELFVEDPAAEGPLNVYGYSKLLFDQVVRRRLPSLSAPVTGFRYFNVYGPREGHKGRMASVAFHHFHQFATESQVRLFGEYDGWKAGTQQRDFVSVDDVVEVNLHFLDRPTSGIFNLGSGRAQPFNDVAVAVINSALEGQGLPRRNLEELVHDGLIAYVPFPDALKGKYQSFTQANLDRLRAAGYAKPFLSVEQGVRRYCDWLVAQRPR